MIKDIVLGMIGCVLLGSLLWMLLNNAYDSAFEVESEESTESLEGIVVHNSEYDATRDIQKLTWRVAQESCAAKGGVYDYDAVFLGTTVRSELCKKNGVPITGQ